MLLLMLRLGLRRCEAAALKLDDIELALNEFVISGQLQLEHGAAQPALRFNLASQNLDVDDLLSRTLVEKPAAESSTTSTTTSPSKSTAGWARPTS